MSTDEAEEAVIESGAVEATLRERVVVVFSLDVVALRLLGGREGNEDPADAGVVALVELLAELFGGLAFETAAVFSLVDSCSFGIRNIRF